MIPSKTIFKELGKLRPILSKKVSSKIELYIPQKHKNIELSACKIAYYLTNYLLFTICLIDKYDLCGVTNKLPYQSGIMLIRTCFAQTSHTKHINKHVSLQSSSLE